MATLMSERSQGPACDVVYTKGRRALDATIKVVLLVREGATNRMVNSPQEAQALEMMETGRALEQQQQRPATL